MGKTGVALVAAFAVMAMLAASVAAATTPYTGTGYDISYPNCGGPYPTGSFGIVGVTHGQAFTQNTCFGSEYAWATGKTIPASVYMNLNAAIGTTASNGATGPAGKCAKSDKICSAYNYGWNAAQYAYAYAQGQALGSVSAGMVWWLDIETANSWSANTSVNQADIQGAIDYLTATGLTVGIYSTASMWQKITGSWNTSANGWPGAKTQTQTPLPAWDGVGGTTGCTSPSFTGGSAWLVQSTSNGDDLDRAC